MKNDTITLRLRAEEYLDRNPATVAKVPAGDLHKLIEDLQMVTKDGRQFYARLESGSIQDKARNNRQIRMAVTDVSDRVQAREALLQSEEKYKLLFNEMISGYALHEILFDSKGKPVDSLILEVNKTIEWHTGFKKEQLIGKTVREVLPDTEPDWFEKFAEVAVSGNPIHFENYHHQLDKHFMVSAFRLQEGQIAATFTDITDRRRFQKKLQKAHDELGQDLTVLKLHIDFIKRKLPMARSLMQKAFEDILLEVKQTIEKVRRISRDLSPSVLVDLGLNAALRGMLKSFAKHSNIEISMDVPDTINIFSSEQQIAVYRIFQEIITNISKHAQATKVSIVGKKENSKVFFKVQDNGIGFEIEQVKAMSALDKGLGLAAMTERVKMLDGHFEISSQVNSGTRIAFEVPIDSSP